MRRILLWAIILGTGAVLAQLLPDYRFRILVAASLFGVLAASTDIATGLCGVPIFGASMPFAIGAYAVGALSRDGTGFVSSFAVGISVAFLVGTILSWLSFRLRLSPLQFGLVSLLLTLAVEQLISASPTHFGGSNGIADIRMPLVLGTHGLSLTLAAAIAILLVLLWIKQSQLGLIMRAVRDDDLRAAALGYNATHIRVVSVGLASAAAGAAGALYAPVAGIAFPGLFGIVTSLVVSVWIALGRPGSVWGPALTAIVYRVTQNELGSQFENAYLFVFGLLIFLGSKWLMARGHPVSD